jgi:hypothetical protein
MSGVGDSPNLIEFRVRNARFDSRDQGKIGG